MPTPRIPNRLAPFGRPAPDSPALRGADSTADVPSVAEHPAAGAGTAMLPAAVAASPRERSARLWRTGVNATVALAIWLAHALVTPTFLSNPIWLTSDAGVFYSVFHQLSQGQRLYVDVFDHKDPLFYAGHTLAYLAVGLRGPMVWEGILSFVLLVGVLELGARCRLGLIARTVLALAFAAVHFLPPVYIPVHTYQQALALVLLALVLAAGGRPGLAGAAFAAAVASKLPVVTLAPAFCVFVALSGSGASAWRGRLLRAALGAAAMAGLVVVALYVRGELGGYVDALRVNLLYPSLNPPDVTSFIETPSLWGRVVTLFTAPLAVAYLGLVAISAGLAIFVRQPEPAGVPIRATAWLALLTFGGTLMTLNVASWYSHHFQLAGVAFTLALLPPLAFRRAARDGALAPVVRLPRIPSLRLPRVLRPFRARGPALGWAALVAGIGVPALMFGLVGPVLAARVSVQRLGWHPLDPCTLLISVFASPNARRPECELLQQQWPAGTRFATLQGNNPGTLAAWTAPSMVLTCRVFYQFVWLDPALLDEAARCLEGGDADVVFRAAPAGANRRASDPFLDVLRSSYRLARRHGAIEVWARQD